MLALLSLLAAASRLGAAAATPSPACTTEAGVHYPSVHNATALRVCPGVRRKDAVCIVGGGFSGVHLAFLLRRRGFQNVTIFEAEDRLGGFIHTYTPPAGTGDGVTRELGAAFLSPDYDEVPRPAPAFRGRLPRPPALSPACGTRAPRRALAWRL